MDLHTAMDIPHHAARRGAAGGGVRAYLLVARREWRYRRYLLRLHGRSTLRGGVRGRGRANIYPSPSPIPNPIPNHIPNSTQVGPCGAARWVFDAAAPIFSAPCLFRGGDPLAERVLLTAQSGQLVCLDPSPNSNPDPHSNPDPNPHPHPNPNPRPNQVCLETARGTLCWSQPAEVHGHSSPAVDTACGVRSDTAGHRAAPGSVSSGSQHGVDEEARAAPYRARVAVVGAVDGTIHAFDAGDGSPLGAARLGAPIFSSPVVCAGRVVVGCRDDGLHCLTLIRASPNHSGGHKRKFTLE